MKAIYTLKLGILIGLLGLCACSNQDDNTDNDLNTQISLASVSIQSLAGEADVTDIAGEYYFGWTNTAGTPTFIPVTIDATGTVGEGGKINAYWESVNKNKELYLSNTVNFTETDNVTVPKDILYNKKNNSPNQNAISFILSHRMAQAQVELTIPTGWTVQKVWLTDLYKQHEWSNQTGDVTICGNTGEIDLNVEEGNTTCSILLPPQEKGNTSELYVVVKDADQKERTYHRKLPNVMAEYKSGSDDDIIWEDVLLAFKAGRRLKLTANIAENADYQIYFTYATLINWVDQGSGTISARPSGIYTANDWKALVTAYNDTPKDEDRLRKYGSYITDHWEFILQRSINLTDGTEAVKLNSMEAGDKLKAEKALTITGKTAAELGVDSHTEGSITFN